MVTGNEYIFDNINQALAYVLDSEKDALAKDLCRQRPPVVVKHSPELFCVPAPDKMPYVPVDSLDFPQTAFYNNVNDDMFIMTRLSSGRYSLKPNLRNRKYLFRGESGFHSPCRPNLFRNPKQKRFTKEMMRGQEMKLLMLSHPLVQLLDLGIELDGNIYRYEMNLFGLTQHYYNRTSFLDLTSNPKVAAFFATTKYEYETDSYSPIEDENHQPGVLYYYSIDVTQDFGYRNDGTLSRLSTIGLQVFPRSGQQNGFLYIMNKNEDFNDVTQLHAVRFRHNAEISRRIYNDFDGGKSLFPDDILMQHWQSNNVKSSIISNRTIVLNQIDNPEMTLSQVMQEAIDLKFDVRDYIPRFTEEELNSYYDSVWNHCFWSDFCEKIHIPGDNNKKMKQDLLNLPNNPKYRWAFMPDSSHVIDYDNGYLLRKYKRCLT